MGSRWLPVQALGKWSAKEKYSIKTCFMTGAGMGDWCCQASHTEKYFFILFVSML